MNQALPTLADLGIEPPDISHLEIEDGQPVDNIFTERESRCLGETPYSGWEGPEDGRTFVVHTNVGIFPSPSEPPVVPDVLLSLDVKLPKERKEKRHLTYLPWEYGKFPDVVIEIVSNQKGGELGRKLRDYARLGIPYYVVHDPFLLLGKEELYVFELRGGVYTPMAEWWFPRVGLGVTLWYGEYEGDTANWLRWCDIDGEVIPTGAELAAMALAQADQARQQAERERQEASLALDRAEEAEQRAAEEQSRAEEAERRAEEERLRAEEERLRAAEAERRAEEERARAEQLLKRLRALGVDPA